MDKNDDEFCNPLSRHRSTVDDSATTSLHLYLSTIDRLSTSTVCFQVQMLLCQAFHPPPPLPCRISSVNVPVCLMTFLNRFLLVCPEFKCQYFAPDCRCQCGYRYRLNRVNLWFNRTLLRTLSFQIALNFKRALVAKGHPSSNCPPTSIFSLTSTVFCDDSSQIFEWFDFL